MEILVPVDFRNTSFAAYCYANNLAHSMKANLILIHVISSKSKINEYLEDDLLEMMRKTSEDRLLDFAINYPKQQDIRLKEVPTKYIISYGDPGQEILKAISQHKSDMVIMGIRDKLNFMERMTGNTATDVMNGSDIPVIMIHANSRYQIPQKAVFAFDRLKDLEDSVEQYLEINEKLKCNTDFVHVSDKHDSKIEKMTEEIVDELFDDHSPEFSFQIKKLNEPSPIQAIHDYCLFEKADLLVMVHRKDSLWDLILNKSKTIKTAYEFHLPLLILPD